MTGKISSSRIAEVMMPPIIGVAMRFITSAPACRAGDHMIGNKPNKSDQQREGDHDFEPFLGRLQILELAGPFDVIARRILNTLTKMLRRLAHVAVDIAGGDIDKNETDQFAVLAAHRGRAGFVMDV